MVTAIVLIQAAAERIPEAAQEIADIDGVRRCTPAQVTWT